VGQQKELKGTGVWKFFKLEESTVAGGSFFSIHGDVLLTLPPCGQGSFPEGQVDFQTFEFNTDTEPIYSCQSQLSQSTRIWERPF